MIAAVSVDHLAAAVEQQDNALLRGRPVGLVGGARATRLQGVSAEASAAGVTPGMRWDDAEARCPGLARVVARPERYATVTGLLATGLSGVAPAVETFAPDLLLLDLTDCQAYYRHDPARIATLLRQAARDTAGLDCRIGISGDRTTACQAGRLAGPGGTGIVPPAAAAGFLAPLPVREVLGGSSGVADFLARHGIERCGDMKRVPIHVPARRFGNLGRRLWLMAQGLDPAPVLPPRVAADEPLQERRLAAATRDLLVLQTAFFDLAGKLAGHLRREGLRRRRFRLGLCAPEGWREEEVTCDLDTDDLRAIAPLCARFLRQHWYGEPVTALRVQAAPAEAVARQADIFLRTLAGGRSR